MTRSIRNALAILLAVIMALSVAACNNQPAQGGESTPTPSSDATPTPAVDYTDGGKFLNDPGANGNLDWRLPAYELKSNTITFLGADEIKLPDADKESSARDLYGITWQTSLVGASDRITKLISSVMGNNSPDIFTYDVFTISLVNKGYLQPWDDYIDFSLGLWDDLQSALDTVRFRDHYYGIGAYCDLDAGDGIWVNLELYEEAGVKSPVEYYKEGNWTWEEYYNCCKDMIQDDDGDGIPEVYGTSLELQNIFVYYAGKDYVSLNPDGTVTNNIQGPEIARAVEFVARLRGTDGLVYDGSDGRVAFTQGKLATMEGCYWYVLDGSYVDMFKRDAIGWVPMPRDPDADKYYTQIVFGQTMLAAGAPNPEGAAAYMSSLRYDTLDTDDNEPVDEEEYFERNGIPYDMAMYIKGERNREGLTPVLMTWQMFDMGQFFGDIYFRPFLGEPWSAIAQEISPKIDDVIETLLEQ